jgi:integrase
MKNGKFQATVYIGRDSDGKQLRKYVTANTEKECKKKARELEMDIEEGKFINISNIRVGKWLDEWLELNKNALATSTYVLYKGYIKNHYKPSFGNLKLSQLNEIHIKKFINDKLETQAQNTVRKLIFVLRKALNEGLKDKSPMNDIEVPSKQKTRFRLITEDEFNIIHQEAKKTIFDECIILLAAWGGMRRGEIFALKPDDIFANESIIRIDEASSISDDGIYKDKRPKSENGFRDVTIPKYLMDLIEKYRLSQGKITDRLFDMRPDRYSHRFKELLNRTTLCGENIVFHDLRHYHASWLYKNGMPDLYSAERLGHDINTLKQIYQHMDKSIKLENDKKIIDMMN